MPRDGSYPPGISARMQQPSALIRRSMPAARTNSLWISPWAVLVSAGVGAVPLASGAQRFDQPIRITTPFATDQALALVDVDADGQVDIVAVDRDEGVVFVTPRVGSSQFDVARVLDLELPAGQVPQAVGSFDIDGDGDLDLFVRGLNSGVAHELLVFENVPPVGLSPVPFERHPLPQTSAVGDVLEFRDLDGDGVVDIHFRPSTTVADFSVDRTDWMALRRTGTYDIVELGEPQRTNAIALADLTGDGLDDLVVVNANLPIWRPQVTPGVFGAPTTLTQLIFTPFVTQVIPADLDQDGDLDLIFRSEGGAPQLVATMNLDGAGSMGPEVVLHFGSPPIGNVRLYDVDTDGDLDLLADPRTDGDQFHWLERLGDTDFGPPAFFGASVRPLGLATLATLTDVSGDGVEDLLLSSPGGYFAFVSGDRPQGERFFGEDLSRVGGPAFEAMQSVVPFDYDGDGDLDLALTLGTPSSELWIAVNRGPGQFDVLVAAKGEVRGLSGLAAADIDGDGDDDLLGYRLDTAVWLSNEANGQFTSTTLMQSGDASGPPAPIAVDIDGDGDLDVLGRMGSGTVLNLFERNNAGTFAAAQALFTTEQRIFAAAPFDIDGDGDLDFAVGGRTFFTRRVWFFEQVSPLVFAPAFTVADDLVEPSSVSWIDVTASGTPDLVWLDAGDRTVMARSWMPSGGLGPAFEVAAVSGRAASIIDLPSRASDGRDLVVGTLASAPDGGGRLEYLRWQQGGGYANAVVITEQVRLPRTVRARDLDLDGDFDLIAGPDVHWLPGRRVPLQGTPGCDAAVPNSTGRRGRLVASGSDDVIAANLRLIGTEMPPNSLAIFLGSLDPGEVLAAGGGPGTLCLGGSIGRFLGPGQVGLTNAEGRRDLELDLTSFPQPTGSVSVMGGQRWYFQGWHRDAAAGGPVSNFTASVSVLFR